MMHGGAWEHEHQQQQQQQEPEEEEEEEEEDEDQVNHHNRNTNMVGVGMGMGVGMGVGVGMGMGMGVGGYVKVMTDDQLETLRKQISAYATICDRLVQMHKSLTSHPDHLPGGVRLGNLYCDPLLTSGGHKITARQRWTPTPVQLQILERIFDQGNGTPTKQKIKEITSQLGQHGHISETNVYNWFQNRRARSKRKHQNTTPPPAESELDTEVEIEVEVDSQSQSQSPKDKKTRPHHHHHHASAPQDIGFQGTEILHFFDPHTSKAEPMFQSNAPLRPSRNLPQMPFYDGNEQLGGKMEVSRGYSLYEAAAAEEEEEDYNMT